MTISIYRFQFHEKFYREKFLPYKFRPHADLEEIARMALQLDPATDILSRWLQYHLSTIFTPPPTCPLAYPRRPHQPNNQTNNQPSTPTTQSSSQPTS